VHARVVERHPPVDDVAHREARKGRGESRLDGDRLETPLEPGRVQVGKEVDAWRGTPANFWRNPVNNADGRRS